MKLFESVPLVATMVVLVQSTLRAHLSGDGVSSVAEEVVNSIHISSPQREAFVIIIRQQESMPIDIHELKAPFGIGVLELPGVKQETEVMQKQVSKLVAQARQLQQVSWPMTVMLVSDDVSFITSFMERSFSAGLLVWSTRFLILCNLPLQQLQHLREKLSKTNSMLLLFSDSPMFRCNVYAELPYGDYQSPPLRLASWTATQGLRLILPQLFPSKYDKLVNGPKLNLTYVEFPSTRKKIVKDPDAPGGFRVITMDPEVTMFEAIAKVMNFTFQAFIPPDMAWGLRMPNGSWTGMIGMLQKEEVDLSLSLFHITEERSHVIDLTFPVTIWYTRTIVRRGNPEVDPWGFLLPLGPFVWLAIVTSLMGVLTIMTFLPFSFPTTKIRCTGLEVNTENCVRVLLQQDVTEDKNFGWWERVVVGVWMLTMLVLTRSYAGNLTSLLAVRYIPMPIHSLQDIVDNPVTILLPRGTTSARQFLDAEDGILKKIGDLRYIGRLRTILVSEYITNLDTLVRRGDHVITTIDSRTKVMVAQDFTETGRCDFYHARDEVLPMMAAFAGPKGSALVPPFNRRVMRMAETGLYYHLLKHYTPNFTACLNPPKKVAVRTTLGLTNLWGILVVWLGGGVLSVLVFCLETSIFRLHQ